MSSNGEKTGREPTVYPAPHPYQQYAINAVSPPYQAPGNGVPATEIHHHSSDESSGYSNLPVDGEKEEDEDGIPQLGKGPGGVPQKNFTVGFLILFCH